MLLFFAQKVKLCYHLVNKMIAKLKGPVIFKDEKSVIIDANGVGYRIFTPAHCLLTFKIDETAEIWTHLSVKETSLEIFGFLSQSELNFFELLISISGIGPRSALGILNLAEIESLKKGISEGDITYLTKVSGIGKKTAEKIVVELKDKLGSKGSQASSTKEDVEVVEALKALGYSQEEARSALKSVSTETQGTSAKIKEALRILSN